jgi:hypothetical protein
MAHLSSHLSDEERSFLRELFRESAPDATESNKRGEIEFEAIGAESRLLLDLLSRMDAAIQAEDTKQRLHFKLEVVPSPFGGPARLRVYAPLVAERQQAAPGAVPAEPGIGVRDASGTLQPVHVDDLSDKGMTLTVKRPVLPGSRMPQLELALPGCGPVWVGGRVLRVQRDPGAAVYRLVVAFEDIQPSAQEALRKYMLGRGLPNVGSTTGAV